MPGGPAVARNTPEPSNGGGLRRLRATGCATSSALPGLDVLRLRIPGAHAARLATVALPGLRLVGRPIGLRGFAPLASDGRPSRAWVGRSVDRFPGVRTPG